MSEIARLAALVAVSPKQGIKMRIEKARASRRVGQAARRSALMILLSTVGIQSEMVWAGINEWTSLGLVGEFLNALATDPNNSSILYAAGRGIFKSTDRGESWRAINSGLTATGIVSLAIDPRNPSTIYAGTGAIYAGTSATGAQIFKTTNGGNSWSGASSGLPTTSGYVSAIAIDPQTPSAVYAGVTFGGGAPALFKSTDGGTTWNETHWVLPVNYGGVDTVAIDLQDPTRIYAAGTFGVVKSTDRGSSWSVANSGLPSCAENWFLFTCHVSLVIDPQNPRTLYAGVYGAGVFKSTDGGASWSAANTGLVSVGPLAIDSQNPNTLYAGTVTYCGCQEDPMSSGMWKATNGETSWSPINSDLPLYPDGRYVDIRSIAIDLQNPYTLYAATYPVGVSAITFASVFSPILMLDTADHCIESSWTLTVSNAISNASIRLQGATNDQPWEIGAWQTTGSDGRARIQGTFPPGTEGRYTLSVEVGGHFSNTISFAVSSCRP